MNTPVITGVGVVSAFGYGAGRLFDGLAAGHSAVGPIRSFDAGSFITRVAGEVPGPLPVEPGAPAASGHSDRKAVFGAAAALEAWSQAGCGPADRDHAVPVVAVGLEQALLEDFAPLLAATTTGSLPAVLPPEPGYRVPLDASLSLLRRRLGLPRSPIVHVSACAAGTLAVAHAAALVQRGEAEVVLTGGMDSMINPLGLGGMTRLGATSPRNEADACRPFDRRRDGLVMGEGAAMFVVEAEARARARGARPLARLLGWGSSQDGYRVTTPRPDGRSAAAAITRALARAGLPPAAVGYVNAHGTGTPLNDPAEARAIQLALGAHGGRVPVSSIKGAVGHLMAAAGAIEIAACLLAFNRDLLPGTAHHHQLDPDCPLTVLGSPAPAATIEVVLSNSFGFGGQNASILLGRCP
jgi:3-oxoacyl-[acyl-carrier-protein] synthase II